MNHKGRTLDEKFLIKIYQVAFERGNPSQPIDFPSIARSLGIKDTAMNTIIKHLAQANFLKKINDTTLRLTELGCRFVVNEIENDNE